MNLRDVGLPDILLVLLIIYNAGLASCQRPTIDEGPADQTVYPADDVRFACTVNGKTEDYVVAWYRNGQRITRGNNESIDSVHADPARFALLGDWGRGDFSLTIRGVISSDARTHFSCSVVSRAGVQVVSSEVATLNVQYPPDPSSYICSPFEMEWSDLRIDYTVIFRCQSDKGNPSASLYATYDSVPVNELNATEEETEFQKALTYVKKIGIDDNGKEFICKLTQDLLDQPKPCKVGPLVVLYPPMDIAITTDSTAVLPPSNSEVAMVNVDAQGIVFTCSATANPEAEYTWTVTEAQGCSKGQHHTATNNVFVITKATMAYNGAIITCTANNTIGKASASITIAVINDDPNALCYSTPKPVEEVTAAPPTKAPVTDPVSLTTMHIIIIIIAIAFLLVIIILGYIAFSRRRDQPIQLTMMSGAGDDTRSIAESIIFQSRHNTPNPEHRGNSLGRMQSNFSTMSYDTQSIDSATALMHLKSLESPEYKANPKLTGSPTRKPYNKGAKEMPMDDMDKSPFHRVQMTDNVYEGSPKRGSPPSPPNEKCGLTRQPSEHKYEECPPLKKYTTHASQTDLAFNDDIIEEERQEITDSSDTDDDFDYNPKKENFSLNNCNIRFAKHTEV